MKKFLTATALLTLLSAPAFAAAQCSVADADMQPKDVLQKKLEGEGWSINNIKTTNGCYEVYGKDGTGKRRETFFDPKSFAELGED